MSCRYRFQRFCISGLLLSFVIACTATDAQLEPLWTPFPGERDVGGCDQDLQNPKDSYSQAIAMAYSAIDALGNIEKKKPQDPLEGQEWDRQARMAKAMFDIDTDPASGIPSKMRLRRARVVGERSHHE